MKHGSTTEMVVPKPEADAIGRWLAVARALGADPSTEAPATVLEWARTVIDWRDRAQLTSHRSVAEAVDALMTPALYAIPHLALDSDSVVVDLGAGSGCTAVSLCAAMRTGRWVLIDRSETKVTFCRYAIRKCRTEGVEAATPAAVIAREIGDAVLARGLPSDGESYRLAASWCRTDGVIITWDPEPSKDESRPSVRCGALPVWVTASTRRFT